MATITVTGAAGYLGSWVVAEALALGHKVHATVRDLGDEAKTAHLLQLGARHPGQLHLFAADLLRDGSFDAALVQADYLIHTASPYTRAALRDVQRDMLGPAVDGTRNVLASAKRCPALRRVALTSSIMAMMSSLRDAYAHPGHMLDESHWNTGSTTDDEPYSYAKTCAERAAWDICGAQAQWQLVVLNPGAIFGPSLSRRSDAESVKMMQQFLKGSFAAGVPALHLGVVDVRDVAAAHVRAVLDPAAHGRYLLVAESCPLLRIGATISDRCPAFRARMPRRELPRWLVWLAAPAIGMRRDYVRDNVGFAAQYNTARSRTGLGLSYRSIASTLGDHVEQLERDGLLA
ncbi:NAD-dependent epimerase/dehydratase family protein [Massilia scottii]|uniref:NAD-dependent epimerase/dehydratase family protein n=1 Tax=Massilia scottii TaxID=3057166 RepID=UPI0027969AC0|nr:NAD-dependent epimerase/dehydratase family protein [Massilia sp. CCM 9029]MDQ1833878.1 NAD-dependent epimerase/dehydratase family protein [Massilia sp. CCM 9029]